MKAERKSVYSTWLLIMRLIQEKESKQLYEIQEQLLRSIEEMGNSDDVLRLALLQTFPPVGDFGAAMEVLKNYWMEYKDVRILLIGAHISIIFDYEDEYDFLDILLCNEQVYSKEVQSIIYYIKALHMRNRDCSEQEIIENLSKSVDLCGDFVYNYLELSRYTHGEEREKLIIAAKKNVEKLYTISDIKQYSDFDLADPTLYIDSMIKGTIMQEDDYVMKLDESCKVFADNGD